MRPRGRKLVFGLLALLISFALIECGLHLLSLVSSNVYRQLVSTATLPTVPDDVLGWRPNPKHPEHDRNGFRNKTIPEAICLLALGDSQVYGVGVAPDEAWPQQLGAMLGCATYNMGFGGYGPAHNLVLLDEALDLQPQRIVQSIYFGNDFFDSYWLIYEHHQLSRYRNRDATILVGLADAEARKPLMELLAENFGVGVSGGGTLQSRLADRIRTLGLLRAVRNASRRMLAGRGEQSLPAESKQRVAEGPGVFDDGRFHTIFTPARRQVALNPADARILEGKRISLVVLEEMRSRTEGIGAEFYVLLIPTKESVFRRLVGTAGVNPVDGYRKMVEDEEQFRQSTKRFLEEERFVYVDAEPALRGCLDEGRQPYPRSESGHPNAVGYEAIARSVLSMITTGEATGR